MVFRCGGRNLFTTLLVLTLLTSALVGCQLTEPSAPSSAVTHAPASPTSASGIDAWPVASPPLPDMSLAPSQSTVQPGDVITRTIRGAHAHILIGNDYRLDKVGPEMMLEQNVRGSCRLLYYLWISSQGNKPGYVSAATDIIIPLIGLPPDPTTIQIPNLSPGTYRLREDVEREDLLTPLPATPSPPVRTFTLYATIQVVRSASTPAAERTD